MTWKTAFRSIYYDGAPEPQDPDLDPAHTALLVIDVQNTYLERPDRASLSPRRAAALRRLDPVPRAHAPTVIPRTQELASAFRESGIECMFARIACHTKNGRDRSLSQKMPGWNNLLLPKNEAPSQIIAELAARQGDEIDVTKTTDSALTGTNLRLILTNLGIKTVICCGIFTDQCVSSTVRSLADESFAVVVVEDCCAAGSDELHRKELEIMNMIYCHVMSAQNIKHLMALAIAAQGSNSPDLPVNTLPMQNDIALVVITASPCCGRRAMRDRAADWPHGYAVGGRSARCVRRLWAKGE